MITTKRIAIFKTARYYIIGEQSEKINSVWFVLHGYGQLAEDFILNFSRSDIRNPLLSADKQISGTNGGFTKSIFDETTLVVAPEALNKFYLKGFGGKIGATWMTKEERESEISDYVNYLDSVYDEVIKYGLISKAVITVLGFSQGTATACRWLTKGRSEIDRLILWGGGIPPDVDLKSTQKLFNSVNLSIVLGDRDEFISEEQIIKEKERLEGNKLNFSLYRYKGKHEIKSELLLKYFC